MGAAHTYVSPGAPASRAPLLVGGLAVQAQLRLRGLPRGDALVALAREARQLAHRLVELAPARAPPLRVVGLHQPSHLRAAGGP